MLDSVLATMPVFALLVTLRSVSHARKLPDGALWRKGVAVVVLIGEAVIWYATLGIIAMAVIAGPVAVYLDPGFTPPSMAATRAMSTGAMAAVSMAIVWSAGQAVCRWLERTATTLVTTRRPSGGNCWEM